jgi:hypothetical protein
VSKVIQPKRTIITGAKKPLNLIGTKPSIFKGYGLVSTNFIGLLDLYPGAAAAYSVRRLSSTYEGALIRVREDVGDEEADIGFDANGDLDTTALLAHCGGNNGFITTWYDQSGNTLNYIQSTESQQPQIVSSGTIIQDNSKPLISAVNGSTELDSLLAGSANRWIFGVIRVQSGVISCFYFEPFNNYVALSQNGSFSTFVNGANLNAIYKDGSAITASRDSMYDNFLTSGIVTIDIDDSGFSTSTLGYGAAGSIGMYNSQELIFYNSDQTANKSGIETLIAEYYGITLP